MTTKPSTPQNNPPSHSPNGSVSATEQIAPRIAIDLDGVLTENPAPLAHAANVRFELDLPERAFVDSAGLNVAMHVREWVYSDNGPAHSLQPAPGAQDFLQDAIRLFGEGNALIITARPEGSAAMTIAWLKRWVDADPRYGRFSVE